MGLMSFKRISRDPLPPKPEPPAAASPKIDPATLVAIAKGLADGTGNSPFGPTSGVLLYADSDDGIAGHHKQWSIVQNDKSLTTKWGKVGATLQSNTKWYGSARMAAEMMQKTIAAKRAKGYRDKR